MSYPNRKQLLEDNLYAVVKDIDQSEILFRKFDTGLYIASTDVKGEVNGFIRLSNEQIEIIKDAPTIKAGDGTSPQTLLIR